MLTPSSLAASDRVSQRVWFLAPTVTLCEQQSKVFETYLPSYNVLVLSGQDDVDHWAEQSVWDAVLHNVRIVLSTHQVLLDALSHAFVKMDDLALLIFDEGRCCCELQSANLTDLQPTIVPLIIQLIASCQTSIVRGPGVETRAFPIFWV